MIAGRVSTCIFTAALCLGCGQPTPTRTSPRAPAAERQPVAGHESEANPCAPGQPCGGASPAKAGATPEADFTGWRSWTKLTPKPVLSKGHGGKYVEVWVEPSHVDAYKAGKTPVGMEICKTNFKDAAGKQLVNLTVMKKMPQGYDPKNGDWWYGVLDETAAKAMSQGKVDMCIQCHDGARHDHLFGPSKLFGAP